MLVHMQAIICALCCLFEWERAVISWYQIKIIFKKIYYRNDCLLKWSPSGLLWCSSFAFRMWQGWPHTTFVTNPMLTSSVSRFLSSFTSLFNMFAVETAVYGLMSVTYEVTQESGNCLDILKQLISLSSERAIERSHWQVNHNFFTLTHANMKSVYCSLFPSLYLSSREPSRPTSLLPADWSSGLGLGREDEPLPSGLETIPLRLMQQDCTAVKTLLLRLRRTLQEVRYAHSITSIQHGSTLRLTIAKHRNNTTIDPNNLIPLWSSYRCVKSLYTSKGEGLINDMK